MKRGRGFVILAIVAALALGVGGFYAWKLIKARADNLTLTAQFDNSAGLYPTNNVQVLGMKVGSVTKVTPKNGYVEVEFTVDKNVKDPGRRHGRDAADLDPGRALGRVDPGVPG